MNIRANILCCCTFLCVEPLSAQENTDVIVMKNGDRLTCEIKGLNGGVLSVKLNYVDGTIAVQWSQLFAYRMMGADASNPPASIK